MPGECHRKPQAFSSQTRHDLIDEVAERILQTACLAEARFHFPEGFAAQDIQPQKFESEAGIEIVMHRLEPLGEKRGYPLWRAQGGGRSNLDAEDPAIHAKHHEFEKPAAMSAVFKLRPEGACKPTCHIEDHLMVADRLGQLPFGRQEGHGPAWGDRLIDGPKRLVEPQQNQPSETPGKRGPGNREQFAHPLQPDLGKIGHGFAGQAKGTDRQRLQGLTLAACGDDIGA